MYNLRVIHTANAFKVNLYIYVWQSKIDFVKKTYASGIAFVCSYVALVSLGILFAVLLKLYQAEKDAKEAFLMEIVFNEQTSAPKAQQVFTAIQKSNYSKSAVFISKDSALQIVEAAIGKNAIGFLDENPLYNSIQLHLKNEYVRSLSVTNIESQIKKIKGVDDVRYSYDSLRELEKTLPVIRLVALITAGVIIFFTLLTLFFVTRLTLSFEKLTIESMKLFGATRWFIAKPYMTWSLVNSLLAAVLAIATLFCLGYYLSVLFQQLHLINDLYTFALLSGALATFAIVFIPLSAAVAIRRHLNY